MPDHSAWLRLPDARPFYRALIDREESHAWLAEDVILLIAGECDLIKMDRPNSHGYQGITQIGKKELAALGWRDADGPFCLAPADVQIEYTGRFFQEWRDRLKFPRWLSAGHLWAANLAPAHSKRIDEIVYAELEHPNQYRANRWLDLNKDGVIHRHELTRALLERAVPRCAGRYELALASLATVRLEDAKPLRPYTPNVRPGSVVLLPRRPRGEDDPPPEAA